MAVDNVTARRGREDAVIRKALALLESRLRQPGELLTTSGTVKAFLALHLAQRDAESFWVLFLDTQNRLLSADEMFRGTHRETVVHRREIARRALLHNASGVILAHNHPSGVAEPSANDIDITLNIESDLKKFDVLVLDHVIVAGLKVVSFRESGFLVDGAAPPVKVRRRRKSKHLTRRK